jgi:hypothetical protein
MHHNGDPSKHSSLIVIRCIVVNQHRLLVSNGKLSSDITVLPIRTLCWQVTTQALTLITKTLPSRSRLTSWQAALILTRGAAARLAHGSITNVVTGCRQPLRALPSLPATDSAAGPDMLGVMSTWACLQVLSVHDADCRPLQIACVGISLHRLTPIENAGAHDGKCSVPRATRYAALRKQCCLMSRAFQPCQ